MKNFKDNIGWWLGIAVIVIPALFFVFKGNVQAQVNKESIEEIELDVKQHRNDDIKVIEDVATIKEKVENMEKTLIRIENKIDK